MKVWTSYNESSEKTDSVKRPSHKPYRNVQDCMQLGAGLFLLASPGTLAQLQYHLWRGIQPRKVMKCPSNNYYTPQEDKIINLWIKLDTNANPNVTNIYFRLRLNGTLCDVYLIFHVYLITCNPGHKWNSGQLCLSQGNIVPHAICTNFM